MQFVLDENRTLGGNDIFAWLGIVIICSAHNAVAVADKPHLPAPAAVDNGACRGASGRLCPQPDCIRAVSCVYFMYGFRHAFAEILHACLFRHGGDKLPYGFHAQAPVAQAAVYPHGSLAGAAVYYGNEAIAYRYPVFALLPGAFSYGRSLYDFHCMVLWV